jgi:hypothetical protein
MFTPVDIVSFDCDLNNGPNDVLCLMNVCGCVEAVYPDMLEYGQYRGFDIEMDSCVMELGRTIEFSVPVLVLMGR